MLRASDVMTKDVITVSPSDPIEEVAALLSQHRIGAVPVTDFRRSVVGIICEGDLARLTRTARQVARWRGEDLIDLANWYITTRGLTASDVMTVPVVCVAEDTSFSEVAQCFDRALIKRAPVVADNVLVGIVSRSDLTLATVNGKRGAAPSTRGLGDSQEAYEGAFQSMRSGLWPATVGAAR